MKLKQRLVLFPCLVAVLWISRPLWLAKDDEQPWKVREKHVGKLIHRHDRSKYHGPFHPDPNYQPERFRRGNEYPANGPRASTNLPPSGVNPPYAQNSQNRDIYLVSLISDQPKSSTPSSTTKSSTTTRTTTTTTSTEPKTSSRRALPRVTTTKAPPSAKAPSGGGSKRELSKGGKAAPAKLPGGASLQLPTMKPSIRKKFIEDEIERIGIKLEEKANTNHWEIARDWLRVRSVYPQNHQGLGALMFAMTNTKIMKADILTRGTQLKMMFYLQGNQRAIFKPKRYEREHVIKGNAYDGYDRHNGEIASFHLDRVLNFRRAPIVVGRKINLETEILPVATQRLKDTFKKKNGNTCFYGQCYYCKQTELACGHGEIMEGSLTLWLADTFTLEKVRHPYQRTYRDDKSAKWETDPDYCNVYVKPNPPYDKGVRFLDLIDMAIFDFIIGNADRHHYEVWADQPESMIILLDNAKSFGNPHHDELSILAPVAQCCLLRRSTFDRLVELKGGLMTKMLIEATRTDPISPILHKKHIEAINRRMPIIFQTLTKCVQEHGRDAVIVESWKRPES